MSLIELKNIDFEYEDHTSVFSQFSLSIDQGDFVIIKGDNGCGKSTLFQILNGLRFPTKGQYLYNDILITKKHLSNQMNQKLFHKSIGYLFQNVDVMLFNGTVYDEIAFGCRQMGMDENLVDQRVIDCAKLFEIESLLYKAPYHLSGGQKKKVALASIISMNPDVVILDEPFAGLDESTQTWFVSFLNELHNANKTIIIATHNPTILNTLATKTIQL